MSPEYKTLEFIFFHPLKKFEISRHNINIYQHLIPFLQAERSQGIEILPHGRQGPTNLTKATPWLLMTWRHMEPEHQQPRSWPSSPRIIQPKHQMDLMGQRRLRGHSPDENQYLQTRCTHNLVAVLFSYSSTDEQPPRYLRLRKKSYIDLYCANPWKCFENHWSYFSTSSYYNNISRVYRNSVVTPLVTHCSYKSLNYRNMHHIPALWKCFLTSSSVTSKGKFPRNST